MIIAKCELLYYRDFGKYKWSCGGNISKNTRDYQEYVDLGRWFMIAFMVIEKIARGKQNENINLVSEGRVGKYIICRALRVLVAARKLDSFHWVVADI
jgi:hypothetical protein